MSDKIFKEIYKKIIGRLEAELPATLAYHNAQHTEYVVDKAHMLAIHENITGRELELVKIAALYHDTGFLLDHLEHENLGCQIVSQDLEELLNPEELEKVCGMITATKIPQRPQNLMEMIVADADLFYMGTSNYKKFSQRLYLEMKHFNPSIGDEKWLEIQLNFLATHNYHTTYGKNMLEPQKQKVLTSLQKEKTKTGKM